MSALPSTGRADHAVLGADATRTLYERHGSRIFAFCFSRLGNREEAEDATQTTFLNAFRSLHGGVVPAFELAWLFRIADNVCRDRRKSAWRRNRFEAARDLDELHDVIPAPENGSDGLAGLGDALASMPERQRRAILLREWQGLTYGEIAQELGVTPSAVETLIFRARRSLARELEAPQSRRRAGLDLASFLAFAKTLFSGGSAVKVAAAVAGAGLLVAAPLRDSERPRPDAAATRPAAAVTRPAAAVTPAASEPAGSPSSTVSAGGARPSPVTVTGDRAVRVNADAPAPSAARARKAPGPSAAKAAPSASGPASGPDARPEPSSPHPAPSASPPPAAETPVAPPPAPALPALPPPPDVPAVEPPPLPELPDVPVDVPGVPPLPPLP